TEQTERGSARDPLLWQDSGDTLAVHRRRQRRRWMLRRQGYGICIGKSRADGSVISLRQRGRDRADSQKQKQEECAPDEMRFDSGITLLFHFSLALGLMLIF